MSEAKRVRDLRRVFAGESPKTLLVRGMSGNPTRPRDIRERNEIDGSLEKQKPSFGF